MPEELGEQIKQYLEENLSLDSETYGDFDTQGKFRERIVITLKLGSSVISSVSV